MTSRNVEVKIEENVDGDWIERLFTIPVTYQPEERENGLTDSYWYLDGVITNDAGDVFTEDEFVDFCIKNESSFDLSEAYSLADEEEGEERAEAAIEEWESRHDEPLDMDGNCYYS